MNKDLIEQYKLLHTEKKDYGANNILNRYYKDLKEFLIQNECFKILDFGCGKGVLVNRLNKDGFQCLGYDPAIKLSDKINRDIKYDAVVSLDVFEHLEEETLEEELEVIKSLNPKALFFNIGIAMAANVLPDGRNCHTLVKSKTWWDKKIPSFYSGYWLCNSYYNKIGAPSIIQKLVKNET